MRFYNIKIQRKQSVPETYLALPQKEQALILKKFSTNIGCLNAGKRCGIGRIIWMSSI
jgi:hypothetical protein